MNWPYSCFIINRCQEIVSPFFISKGNNVDGKMFLKLTRTDLKELFPDDFPTRKSLWGLLSSMVSLYYDGIQTSFFHCFPVS